MDSNLITILNEEFENGENGEKVQGITIIIDGKLREVINLLLKRNSRYNNLVEVIKEALFIGINSMILDCK